MGMEWNREKTEKAFVIFGKVMLVAVVILNAWLTYKCYFNFLRSDDSSELVMSRLLSKEGGILSGNWYYSTELEILNTQLVYSLLFHFTSDFKFVRIAGQIILTILFLGSYYFCLYSMDSQKAENRFWKTAFLTILPISSAWIYLIMKAYYIPITGIGFLALGLACQAQKEGLSKKRKAVLFALGSVLAFVSCLEDCAIFSWHICLLLQAFYGSGGTKEKTRNGMTACSICHADFCSAWDGYALHLPDIW